MTVLAAGYLLLLHELFPALDITYTSTALVASNRAFNYNYSNIPERQR